MAGDTFLSSSRSRFRTAMILAVLADAVQIGIFPMFVQGALSPLDDVFDVAMAAVLYRLLGWHWELLPSSVAKLIPGVDLVPLWTLAVANIWRKHKPEEPSGDIIDVTPPPGPDASHSATLGPK
jgi:hypothetical protein